MQQRRSSIPPELPVLADGHHDQHVSQDAHQHDQRQEADQSHPLRHAVATETAERRETQDNTSVEMAEGEANGRAAAPRPLG